jgi:hypothetical protein
MQQQSSVIRVSTASLHVQWSARFSLSGSGSRGGTEFEEEQKWKSARGRTYAEEQVWNGLKQRYVIASTTKATSRQYHESGERSTGFTVTLRITVIRFRFF